MKTVIAATLLLATGAAFAQAPGPTPRPAYDAELAKSEMVADYHKHFGSAALMQVPKTHPRIAKKPM